MKKKPYAIIWVVIFITIIVFIFAVSCKAPKILMDITVDTPPTKLEYKLGEELNPEGMVISAVYDDGSTETVDDYTVSNLDSETSGSKIITVSYNGKNTAFIVYVNRTIDSISVTTIPAKVVYTIDDIFNPAGMVITAFFDDGSSAIVTGYTLSGFDSSELGNNSITVEYEGKTTSFEIIVSKVQGFSITFASIIDLAPFIEGPTIYILPGREGKPTSVTLTLDAPSQYDENSIVWEITGTSITGNGASFTLDSENLPNNLIGDYFLTLEVKKDSIPYNKTVIFTVAP